MNRTTTTIDPWGHTDADYARAGQAVADRIDELARLPRRPRGLAPPRCIWCGLPGSAMTLDLRQAHHCYGHETEIRRALGADIDVIDNMGR